MLFEDVRAELPLASWEIGRYGPKTSITVHWNGPPIPAWVHPLDVILGDAWYHISKDWSDAVGVQGGDGIMYHWLIAPDGTIYKTRDDDATLYHCGNEIGNERSYAVQVMVGGDSTGVGDPCTPAQLNALTDLQLDEVKPHRIWSGTTCPGLELTNWVANRSWEMALTDDEFMEKYNRLIAPNLASDLNGMKAVETKVVVAARQAGSFMRQAADILEKNNL